MPASNLKLKSFENDSEGYQHARESSRRAKVVELFKTGRKTRSISLSAKQKENLIITYQIKARKMAFSILRRWHARLDLQEVHSVVDLSLCEAVRHYNPGKGASFMTFLFYHLRGNLIRAVTTAAKLNAVPFSQIEPHHGEDGDSGRTVASRGISAIEVAEALSSRDCPMPDEILMKKELIRTSLEACEALDKLEKEVLYRIFLQEEPLLDVAASLGYSRCHISRVKRRALETLFNDINFRMYGEEGLKMKRPTTEDEEEAKPLRSRRAVQRRKPRAGDKIRAARVAARLTSRPTLDKANAIVASYA